MNPAVQQTLSQVLDLSIQMATLAAAAAPFVLPFVPAILRAASNRIQDGKRRRAFEVVSQLGTLATSIAAAEVQRALEDAAKPDSPGGSAITPEERQAALAKGAAAAWRWAQEQGLKSAVLDVYRDEGLVADSIKAKVRQNLDGNPAGLKDPGTTVVLPTGGVQ